MPLDLPSTPEIHLPKGFHSPEAYAQALISHLTSHLTLIEAHVVEALAEDHWSRLLPPDWAQALAQPSLTPEILVDMVAHGQVPTDAWPQSLVDYVNTCRHLSLPRVCQLPYSAEERAMEDALLPGMNPKKKHEVGYLSSLIHQVARETRVRLVLDLGSGQGYLGRTLAFQKGLRVCAIDASSIQTSGALHLTQRAGKGRDEGTRGRLQHLTHTVGSYASLADLDRELGGGRIMEIPDQGKGEEATRWMVCGLHGCGDLTSHTLRLFAHGDASALVSVGCCYNLLTTSNPEATARGPGGPDAPRPPHPGFPMSRLVGEGKEALTLPTAAFQLACQTPGRWRVQREETIRGFTHHYYRSLLHLLMLQEGLIPSGSKESAPRVGRLRPRAFRDFGTYVSMAMTKMGMEEKGREMGESKALDLLAHGEKQGWAKHIAALWSLRALLAPCIESLIVLDRWFFLKEQGVSRAWILSGWEEEVSPRNLILIAQRSS